MEILHLEDNPDDAELVRALITDEWPDCKITCVASRFAFVGELSLRRFDLILSDFALLSMDGLEALKIAKAQVPETPFIFLSGTIGEDRAIEAVRCGAEDYVLKDRMKRLITAINRAIRDSVERQRRQEAERRIREQAEMLNQAREAIFITDLENRVIYWNAGAERLFGWPADEMMGKTAEQVLDAATLPSVVQARSEALQHGTWLGELRMLNRQRQPIFVESRQSMIRDEAGRLKARLCINSDITERKKLEEQFLRAQRMENIGMLAAGISHDLNNMLAPILLAAPMLREHVQDPGALSLLTTLERSAERGANLVRQILAFAHGATGEHRLLQVKHLMRDISSVITGTFPKSIRLEEHIPSDLWPILGNPTQVHQVLLNLCVNARDAMPAGGVLRLAAGNRVLDDVAAAAIEGARVGAFLTLEVADTGQGISPETLRRMWEPFFTTKGAEKGTGLGLSTVRGIVERHGGFIEVYTAENRGSTFRVYLPAAENGPADGSTAPMQSLPRGKGELILVVDDERHIREMTRTILTRSGYRVILAADGAEAATVFGQRAAEIRLVITDLHMPNLDGAMLGGVLRRINPTTRLLVVSGLASGLGNRTGPKPEDFANGVLHKPFKPEALLARVDDLLRRASTSAGSVPPWQQT